MALPVDQLQALRDSLVQQLGSAVEAARKADGSSVNFRPIPDLVKAIEAMDEEILKAQGGSSSMSKLAQHKRGDGPPGPSPTGWSNPWI